MSHSPELPERYVCENCYVVSAGVVVGGEGESHQYAAPDQCGACGSSEFVTMEQYPHEPPRE